LEELFLEKWQKRGRKTQWKKEGYDEGAGELMEKRLGSFGCLMPCH